jgi:tetratricopeptide (TPR) repeat protein
VIAGRLGPRLGWLAGLARLAGIVGLCVLAASCARRLPAVPGTGAYPEYVAPSERGEPAAVVAQVQQAWTALQANDLRTASREAAAATTRAPASVAAGTMQGYVALASRRHAEALAAFDASLARRRNDVPSLVGRGYALVELDRDLEGLEALQAALDADRSLAEVRRRAETVRLRAVDEAVSEARSARAAGRLDDARARYARAIELSPESAFLYRDRAAVERQQNRLSEAIADLRRAVSLDPSDPEGLAALGSALAAAGELREAEKAYQQAYALDPSDTIRLDLGRVRQQQRDAALPRQVRDIESRGQVTRGDLAALLGVRFESLLRAAPSAPLVITDLTDDWSRSWIMTVAGTGVMEPYANHTFQPAAPALRADMAAASWRLLAIAAPARPALRPYLEERPRIADVGQTHPFYTAAASAVASGVMPLLDGGRFNGSGSLSGADAAAAVGRLRVLLALE